MAWFAHAVAGLMSDTGSAAKVTADIGCHISEGCDGQVLTLRMPGDVMRKVSLRPMSVAVSPADRALRVNAAYTGGGVLRLERLNFVLCDATQMWDWEQPVETPSERVQGAVAADVSEDEKGNHNLVVHLLSPEAAAWGLKPMRLDDAKWRLLFSVDSKVMGPGWMDMTYIDLRVEDTLPRFSRPKVRQRLWFK